MAHAGLIIWMSISSFLCMIKGSVLDLNKNRKLYLGFFAFGCFCIMALRSVDVGVDTYHYSVIYEHMYNNYYSNQKEILEAGMVKIMWAIVTAISLYQIYFSRSKNRYYSVYAMASLIFVAANVIGLIFNYIERLGMYFVPFVILMLEDFGENFEGTWIRRLYWITSGTCFLAFFLITCMSSFQYHYSIWL